MPVVLAVVCRDHATATWAAGPLRLGHDLWTCLSVSPIVLGPHNVPAVLDVDTARHDLPLAALSAITHARQPHIGAILESVAEAFRQAGDQDETQLFIELVYHGLGRTKAGTTWKELMDADLSYFRGPLAQALREEGRDEGRALGRDEGREEGMDEGRAKDVLLILRHRGVHISEDAAERVTACRDQRTFDLWMRRALEISRIEELFD
ncbi:MULTISPECIES: RpnC/YadD family protein [unclassified Nocardia]|uniref:hypothetical protein n=1 Tax=Nocardia sp. NPDC003239 TaxID=3154445 RepID=UPI0033AB9944